MLYINLISNCYDNRRYDSVEDEKEGNDFYSTSTSWTFESITKRRTPNTIDSFTTKVNIKKPIYVVYVVYSTGDSFGSDDSGRCEILGITNEKESAEKVKKYIEEDYKAYDRDKDTYRYNTITMEGMTFHTYTWKGYFESLDEVIIAEYSY